MSQSVVPSVFTKERKNGGGRKESYVWTLPFLSGLCQFPHRIQFPSFPTGFFSTLSWSHGKGEVMLNDGGIAVLLPYPDLLEAGLGGLDSNFKWSIRSVSAIIFCTQRSPVPLDMRLDSDSPGWDNEGTQVYTETFAFDGFGPFRLQMSLNIIGEDRSKIGGAFGNLGAQLVPIVAGAFKSQDELSDVKIICEDETFLCHKLILSLWSPVFKTMFLSDTKESKENQVAVQNLGKDELKVMLEWMYGIDIRTKLRTLQRRLDLYKVAHLYLMDPLKDFLIIEIVRSMTAEDAFEVYLCGDIFEEPKLKAKATEVMKREKNKAFSDYEVFRQCSERFPKLLHEIMIAK